MLRWREVCQRLVGRRGLPVEESRGRAQDWIGQGFRKKGRTELGRENFRLWCRSKRVYNPARNSAAKILIRRDLN